MTVKIFITGNTGILDPCWKHVPYGTQCAWEDEKGTVLFVVPLGKGLPPRPKKGEEVDGKWGGWEYCDGWNGSYHDAWYDPHLLAWAKGSHKLRRARRFLRQAKAWYAKTTRKDSCQARLEARYQVREGD